MTEQLDREKSFKLAKQAYKDMLSLIYRYEEFYPDVSFCWDGCIRVGEYLFHERELR